VSELRIPASEGETIVSITPERARWGYVGFEALRLTDSTATRETGDRELCVVVIAGHAQVGAWSLGGRETPFEGAPDAAYFPPGSSVSISGDAEVGLCWAPAPEGGAEPRPLRASEITPQTRGSGPMERTIHNILMLEREAERLLVTEVQTPAGHWSSYPPHRHERDALPDESLLEETYYHRVDPAHGFVVQRVYTDDRDLDEAIAARDRDTVLVPRGYHPVGVPPGYRSYYLNVMAGPRRTWAFHNDPDHEWLMA
jgi:5-deoxy-glucuronate isomerase